MPTRTLANRLGKVTGAWLTPGVFISIFIIPPLCGTPANFQAYHIRDLGDQGINTACRIPTENAAITLAFSSLNVARLKMPQGIPTQKTAAKIIATGKITAKLVRTTIIWVTGRRTNTGDNKTAAKPRPATQMAPTKMLGKKRTPKSDGLFISLSSDTAAQ